MLAPISNTPRDYAWGSTTLIAHLQGRQASTAPEAEIWFGDHPAGPARVDDGRTLSALLAAGSDATGAPRTLPYLLKLLAAASPLSIQAHPSIAQAEEGFAREESRGIPRDSPERTYRDANHKPELIVAVSDTFRALAGLRDRTATLRLLAVLGDAAASLSSRVDESDGGLDGVIGWVLSGEGRGQSGAIIAAAIAAESDEFAAELDLVAELDAAYPGDPGIVVALLMNLVVLRRDEGLFVPAGVLHAYLEGLGVELMAASDNVLRGGLTPKHIDVGELLSVLDGEPAPAPVVTPRDLAPGVRGYDVPVADFSLRTVVVAPDEDVTVGVDGASIVLATEGSVRVHGAASEVVLLPGSALFATPDEVSLRFSGSGQAFIASPGRAMGD